MTLLSRILGLVRDILWAKFLGASAINDALLTATKLPNLFRRMFAEGAFNAAFVPMYARRLEGEGEDVAANFAGEAMAALTMLVALIVIALQLTMPWSLNLIGGGLDKVAGPNGLVPYDLAVLYARITMPYLLLMSLAALFSDFAKCGLDYRPVMARRSKPSRRDISALSCGFDDAFRFLASWIFSLWLKAVKYSPAA